MRISLGIPGKVKNYAKEEKISTTELKREIIAQLWEDLLDKKYVPVKLKEIRIVMNGVRRSSKSGVFINPGEISEKKPLRTVSYVSGKYSVYYLIFTP